MFDTKPYEDRVTAALGYFEDELKKVRTGRAHPTMLDGITVEVYGTRMPLNQVANISAPEARQLLVSPFDASNVVAVVAAIRDDVSLGFNPSDDGRVVRVPIPQLTEERRREIVRQLGEKVEDCRVGVRAIRHDGLKDAKAMKEAKQLGEDDYKRVEKALDELMSEFQTKIDAISKAKEQEIMTI